MFIKKTFTFIVLLLILSVTVHAQESVYNAFGIQQPESRWQIGIKGGVNFSNIKNYQSYTNSDNSIRTGFHFGLVGEYHLLDNFYFEPAFLFTLKGSNSKYKYEFNEIYDPNDYMPDNPDLDTITFKGTVKDEINLYYLEVPLHFAYRITLSPNSHLDIQFGPYFAVGLFGKTRTFDTNFPNIALFSYDSFDRKRMFVRTDIGLSGGISVGFYKHYRVSVNYEHGLKGMKDDPEKYEKNPKNRNWMISAAYMF